MTYRTLVQDFCTLRNLPVPAGVVGNTNASVRQLALLVQESLEELTAFDFQILSLRKSWTAVAGSDQGTIGTLFGPGYNRLAQNTLWNQTHMMKFIGPLSPEDWNALSVMPAAGVAYYYTVLGDKLLAWPDLAGTETLTAIATSDLLVSSNDGSVLRALPIEDDDLFRIPESVIRRWLNFKWRQAKGESWTAAYEDAVQNTPIFEENGPENFKGVDIMRAVHSFDPCLPCGVHMYGGQGQVRKVMHRPTGMS